MTNKGYNENLRKLSELSNRNINVNIFNFFLFTLFTNLSATKLQLTGKIQRWKMDRGMIEIVSIFI